MELQPWVFVANGSPHFGCNQGLTLSAEARSHRLALVRRTASTIEGDEFPDLQGWRLPTYEQMDWLSWFIFQEPSTTSLMGGKYKQIQDIWG